MTAKNLSTVTTDLITSYGNTAKNVINAYRLGGERMIDFVDQRWERALDKVGAKLKPAVRGNALSAQQKLSGYYTRGISMTTNGADMVVDKVVELASKGVQQAAVNASQFEKSTGVTVLNTVARVTVPAAVAVSELAGKVEQKSSRLAKRIAGKKAAATVAAVKRVTPFKKARSRKAA